MTVNPSCKRSDCSTIGWHVHRDVNSLNERIVSLKAGVHAAALDRDTRYAWLGTIVECQLEIARLTDRVQLFEDAKYPDEIARLEAENDAIRRHCGRHDAAGKTTTECQYCRADTLATQLERAEALLRELSTIPIRIHGTRVVDSIAAYFREKEKP